jgi:site-specific recombinase XerD
VAGEKASRRFLEFFTAEIRNPHTRKAYAQAVSRFLTWCEERRRSLQQLQPVLVAAYVKSLQKASATRRAKRSLPMLIRSLKADCYLLPSPSWLRRYTLTAYR